jgi:dCTP deaminase
MSILLGAEIKSEYDKKNIVIEPYNEEHVGPNSYDVTLSDILKTYDLVSGKSCLDSKKANKTITHMIPEKGYTLLPGKLYLGATVERVGSDCYVPMYEGRSSMARLGIQSHISAGFGDIGFKSHWTLEITVVHPVKIYPFMRIGQVYFHKVSKANVQLYDGKYVDQKGPQESKSYLD